ncbi:tungsten-containing aldehyde ferredoxin oxidoreductase [Geobacter sp. OR-1]|uniref:aldehyde ferredoxin oxidoreductase C-terminal domain-containing protein n=1 Tax=Geobacter sp. OR-1 TaxID=1266765 RepID=UPI0005442055|nr:aldehyde ferredoxin oxidoreductase C-terminal domain-containing protein [Geobacter sp. OR-1]GAM11453.1 tungsten-containing aldehyde ferredoxin oxidoreductase [Geobacter sp. OR-1]
MDKIARIDLGAEGGPKISFEEVGEYTGLGGRALTSLFVAKEVNPLAHPLGAENKLVFAPGMLSGTTGSMTGRLSVGCKSPLTGTIKESNAGGQAAQVLARIGYAAIVLEGKPAGDDLYKIIVNKDGITIEKDNSLKLMDNYPLVAKLRGQYGDKVAYITIGSAGERQLLAASIACTDPELRPTRHCGRGGVGAVMGSKRVKAIILDDAGMKMRAPKDPEKFRDANRKFVEGLRKHPVTGEGLPAYGTNVLTNVLNEAGGYPTRNFKGGVFEGGAKLSGEAQAELEIKRGGSATHGCHRGCVIQCSGIFNDKDGNYVTKQPEYETVWSHGGHCGIDNLDTVAKLDYMDDNIGVDTIEMGVTIGVAMDAGLAEFGDSEGAIRLMEEVGKGTPLGRVLGCGAEITGKVFGVEKVPVVKGQALPAYDPRPIQGIGVTYATTTMGADHTAGYAIATNILKVGGDVDPLKTEGQVELSRNLQIATAAIDSTGMCLFIAFAIMDQPETFQALLDMLGSFYGIEMTGDDVVALGKKVLSAERDFNTRAGFTKHHDRLPRFFYTDPIAPHNQVFSVPDEEIDQLFNW